MSDKMDPGFVPFVTTYEEGEKDATARIVAIIQRRITERDDSKKDEDLYKLLELESLLAEVKGEGRKSE